MKPVYRPALGSTFCSQDRCNQSPPKPVGDEPPIQAPNPASVLAKVYAVISLNILHDQQVHTQQSNTYFIKMNTEYVYIKAHNSTMKTKSN